MPARTCPFCGARLKAEILSGLCPRCMLMQAAPAEVEGQKVEAGNAKSEIGQRRCFGDYELIEELGRGGMGVVYKARQISLNRLVALKMIQSGELASGAEVQRFLLEAEAAASLAHPNIVAVHEVGEQGGQHYFSMRLVEGASLAARMQKGEGGMGNAEVAKVVATVARAVHYAHQRGILHRDLKPWNILIDSAGQPHVTDFGLAKRLDLSGAQSQSGVASGTPNYMSPEQAQAGSEPLTTATDIFSLGAVLYHLLTGRPPFQAATAWETLKQVVEQEPPRPRLFNRRLDRDLETICLKCLEKDPQRRYGSAEALAEDLDRWRRQEPIQARPGSAWEHVVKWARRKPAVAGLIGAVALVAGLGLAASLWYAGDAREKLWQAYLAQARANRLSDQPGRRFDSLDALTKAAAIRPSLGLRNEAIACLALADVREQRRWRLEPPVAVWGGLCFDAKVECYIRAERDGTLRVCQVKDDREVFRLKGEGRPDAVVLRLSPDDRFVAEVYEERRATGLRVWDLTRRELRLALPLSGQGDLEFTPDCQQVATSDATGLIQFHPLAGGKASKPINLGQPHSSLRFAPDGKRLAAADSRRSKVLILDLASEKIMRELEHPGAVGSIAWSQDGQFLACACFDHHVYLWNVSTGTREAVLEGHAGEATGVAFNRSGDLLVSGSWDGITRFWDPKLHEHLIKIPGTWVPLAFGSNDSALGFTVHNREAGVWQVARGAECRRSPVEHFIDGANFSADGRLLATTDETGVGIWDVRRSQLLGRLSTGRSWSALLHPNRTNLLVTGSAGLQRWPIHFDPKTGKIKLGPPETLWSSVLGHAALSPDGGTLVAVNGTRPEVLMLDLVRFGEPRVLTGLPRVACADISPDGGAVAGGTWKGTNVAIWETRNGRLVTLLPVAGTAVVAFSPDGEWLATSSGEECRLWHTRTWASRPPIKRDRAGELPGYLAFSPDGRVLALLGGRLGPTKLVTVPEGRELATLEEGAPLCFSRDGGALVTCNAENKRLAFWDLRLIRPQLASMHLDWDLPSLLPAKPSPGPETLALTVQP